MNMKHFRPDRVQFSEPIQGRLVHVRLEGEPSLDILIVYQFLYASSAAHPGQEGLDRSLEKRAHLWAQLHHRLAGLPARNGLLLTGDFNCDLHEDGQHVGQGLRTRLSRPQPDRDLFQNLLRTFSLQALNTWRGAGRRAETFIPANGGRGTQIDFAITRQRSSDPIARLAQATWLPFVETSGLRHLPLCGSLSMPRVPKLPRKPQAMSLATVRRALRIDPALADLFTSHARSALATASVDNLSALLAQAWQTCAPDTCKPQSQPGHGPQTELILTLWRLRKERRHHLYTQGRATPWPKQQELQNATRELRNMCKARKQQRIRDLLAEAESAAHRGLTAVYQVVRRLSPKTVRKPIQFRAEDGIPLTAAQEAKRIGDYFRCLYKSSCPEDLPSTHWSPPFSRSELCTALMRLPQGKALPSWLAPAPLWALAADALTEVVLPALQGWQENMQEPMPGRWSRSALCLLNKPSKPPKQPENLRPIALLHPISKCLAVLVADRLRPHVQALATRYPQFAYIGQRSVEDSIERACAHCAAARKVLAGQKYNLFERREGHKSGHCKGGLTLSLDLSRAFDCLPRSVLRDALIFAGVAPELMDLILHIHRQSSLLIQHKEHDIPVALHSGVRQGCGLAPCLVEHLYLLCTPFA